MPPEPLTRERILEATEDVLRRYGPAKATVVDVARALGVSHGSVYRHFPTKSLLREAVTQRWLDRNRDELEVFAADTAAPAPERLRRWLDGLFAAKRRKALGDPELFATFTVLAGEKRGTVTRHIEEMTEQLRRILADGTARGEFAPPPAGLPAAARAVWDATTRYHDPAHAPDWSDPDIEAQYAAVRDLVLRGLAGA
ncbi:TetR/AcrR family transcriptional regulator [Streptomyces sp. HPF1205]|uniref:TetR/AcrR family transcriptional regulator n=1 Tax=Streptomyces sp. HPF1205 TaxID=2873262 RepID=UPI001CEC6596|nr:TetR/AcrR family transcriptional regulator [Streptomyces sp. HPF1205]